MSKMSYREQLLDINWQRKRLETLAEANWTCELCSACEGVTLHVHHKHYIKGRLAWEYERQELAVLCEQCHEDETEASANRWQLLGRLDLDGPMSIDDLIAHGCGALYSCGRSGELRGLFYRVFEDKPLQFWSGVIGERLADGLLEKQSVLNLAARLANDEGFRKDLIDWLHERGINRA